MRRLVTAALTGTLAGALAVTGCGSRAAGDAAGTRPTAGATTAAPSPRADDAAEYVRRALAEHDRRFPEIAALGCAASAPPSATAATPRPSGPPQDPEAAKYAENHASRRVSEMTPDGACRGRAHSARITAALAPRAAGKALGPDEVRTELAGLGYGLDGGTVRQTAEGVVFEVFVATAGPCLRGTVGGTVRVAPHGAYAEGGCVEPVSGH